MGCFPFLIQVRVNGADQVESPTITLHPNIGGSILKSGEHQTPVS